ncbi:hypothetical protein TNCV_4433011 [Trichonephila clavipes]|nr:hypothetical protein TNCV_4433011 [Trichonephila clavipes]
MLAPHSYSYYALLGGTPHSLRNAVLESSHPRSLKPTHFEENKCFLREDEVKCHMPEKQRNELGALLTLFGRVFEPGAPYSLHRMPYHPWR